MTKNNLPTERYATLTNLKSLQDEKVKLRVRLRNQEINLKSDIDSFMDMFRFWGSLATITKQISTAIPFFSTIKMVLKLLGFFGKKKNK